jgi:nicotinamidase/pyrazinamidase
MRRYDRILLDVDTQFDFLDPGGSLYVPDSIAIHPRLERLFKYAGRSRTPVLSTADEHGPHDPEYEQFGRHCERGTLGQHKLPFTILPRSIVLRPEDSPPAGVAALLRGYGQVIFNKASLDVFANRHLGRAVEELSVGEYVAFGVATDYCVKTAVQGLLARKARVALVIDAIAAIDAKAGEEVLRQFAGSGVRFVRTTEVVRETETEPPTPDDGDEE